MRLLYPPGGINFFMFNEVKGFLIGVALVAWVCYPVTILAGSVYQLTCENKDCLYTDHVSFGGGMRFDQITGYCSSTGKFVYVIWHREHQTRSGSKEKVSKPKPSPVGQIWLPSMGQYISLYQSKDCPQPVVPINSVEELKFCPKCKQPTLKTKLSLLYD